MTGRVGAARDVRGPPAPVPHGLVWCRRVSLWAPARLPCVARSQEQVGPAHRSRGLRQGRAEEQHVRPLGARSGNAGLWFPDRPRRLTGTCGTLRGGRGKSWLPSGRPTTSRPSRQPRCSWGPVTVSPGGTADAWRVVDRRPPRGAVGVGGRLPQVGRLADTGVAAGGCGGWRDCRRGRFPVGRMTTALNTINCDPRAAG